jgi:ATP-dependent exoDNAse (exonuclease V) beta subunit
MQAVHHQQGPCHVLAGAGSGKTRVITHKIARLLKADLAPREIAAITFTRKAAAEMRGRILAALAQARADPRPGEDHRALTWDLARAALERNDSLGWRLEENSARLRVQTIDSLCASLTRQMPVLAKFGSQPESLEDAGDLYREAARAALAQPFERGFDVGVAHDRHVSCFQARPPRTTSPRSAAAPRGRSARRACAASAARPG